MIKYIFPLFFLLGACNTDSTKEPHTDVDYRMEDSNTSDNISLERDNSISSEKMFSHLITYDEVTGYGYQILENDSLLINQVHIPAVQGINGFSTKEKAERAALYVLEQVKNGIFPPTFTKDKLIELDVL